MSGPSPRRSVLIPIFGLCYLAAAAAVVAVVWLLGEEHRDQAHPAAEAICRQIHLSYCEMLKAKPLGLGRWEHYFAQMFYVVNTSVLSWAMLLLVLPFHLILGIKNFRVDVDEVKRGVATGGTGVAQSLAKSPNSVRFELFFTVSVAFFLTLEIDGLFTGFVFGSTRRAMTPTIMLPASILLINMMLQMTFYFIMPSLARDLIANKRR
ncbi:hypothetical protein FRZ61_21800 [Hypericibacter adhaerens]|uniref:Uncharacterized protein n=1 Tax=Hypericibacter adhaerens TaxID=2602016 RepID=A0A5J6N115_9PROT|nr:hypothetical protein [Hypericibacter adhaerens]QEX22250.1 hypothetical protein FRZ61_21800 [Hypericibacter adhaerens]